MRVVRESAAGPADDLDRSTAPENVLASLDALVEQDADLPEVLATTARLLGRGVGVCTADGVCSHADPGGAMHHDQTAVPESARRLPDGLQVWLEGAPGPDEALLLRRLGVTVKAALRRQPQVSVPAIEVVLDEARSAEARVRAAYQLGLSENASLTVFGLQAGESMLVDIERRIRALAVRTHSYRDGTHLLVIAGGLGPAVADLALPVGSRSSVAHDVRVIDLPAARRDVHLALRYTLPATHDSAPYGKSEAVLVDTASMGGYALLPAHLTPEQIDTVDDVRILDDLRRAYGPDMLVILEAVAATDSVRKAARVVHLHHNSVAQRVTRAEEVLGFRFAEPYGRTRLFLALCLRRVRDSADS